STVSIFLMPAFFFAVAMLASPVAIRPSRLVAVPVPFLAQLVALFSASTGRLWPEYRRPGWNGAVAQPVMASAEAIKAAENTFFIFFFPRVVNKNAIKPPEVTRLHFYYQFMTARQVAPPPAANARRPRQGTPDPVH